MDSGCDIFCTQPANHTAKAQSQIVREMKVSMWKEFNITYFYPPLATPVER